METRRDLRNREARLRRVADKKGLYIQKRKWRQNYDSYNYEVHTGYCIGISEYGLLIYGGDSSGMFLPTLEEAERLVANY